MFGASSELASVMEFGFYCMRKAFESASGVRSPHATFLKPAATDPKQSRFVFIQSYFTKRVKSQIPLRYLVADRSEAGRRPASSLLAS